VRQPGPCVYALCEAIIISLSKKISCPRPRCNAMPNEQFFLISYCILIPHSTIQIYMSAQFILSKFFSSHFISSHMSTKFCLTIFISFEHRSTFFISQKLVSTHLGYAVHQNIISNYKICIKYFPILFCILKIL
jgi:hypothetical protein